MNYLGPISQMFSYGSYNPTFDFQLNSANIRTYPFVKPEQGEMANNYASGSGLYQVKQSNTINQPMFFSKCMIYKDINNEIRQDVELSRHDDKHESLNNQQDSLTMGKFM
ncbi:unnamed protein product [Lupinus luteus]|uniref:Uncharacterized protein n=1 Tax=Lupinus luteus TaxID=3873 RepID=A0AAV1YH05_LUPLU